jgi:heme-degrading monooxygenase HmoA
MFARITTVQGVPGQVGSPEMTERVVATVREQPGFRGIYLLAPQGTGENLAISPWETEEQAKTVGPAVSRVRDEAVAEMGATAAPTVRVYEVISQA